jgi:GT2 family glycosyltransferase
VKRVTVAVLAYNEERNIPGLLDSLERQTYPRDQFDILIVDNGSTDATRDLVGLRQMRQKNLRLIIQPEAGIAVSRNRALRAAQTELIAFTDADVICPPRWLQTLVEGFDRWRAKTPELVAVGGGNVPVASDDRFLMAVGITLNSFWGSHGSAQGMRFAQDHEAPHIPTLNILYDRRKVLDAGGFDNAFRFVCEDPELNYRLTRAGGRIVFIAGAEVEHKMRPDFRSWLRNVYLYGRGRTQIIKKHPNHLRAKFLVPPLLVAALALVFLSPWQPLFLLPLLYFLAPLPIAYRLCAKTGRADLWREAYLILAGNPIAYGVGMIHGLWFKYPPAFKRLVPPGEMKSEN